MRRPDDKRGSAPGERVGAIYEAGSEESRMAARRRSVTHCEYRIWCAERIGWPALAESWRRDLEQAKEQS